MHTHGNRALCNTPTYRINIHNSLQDGQDPFDRLQREQHGGGKKRRRGADTATPAGTSAVPATVKLTSKLDPEAIKGQIAKGKHMKADIAQASQLAGVSTASMGKFDRKLAGESGARKLPGLRQKHLPGSGGAAEGSMVSKVLGKVTRCALRSRVSFL